jgi:glutamyl-tRNA reductase
MPIILAGMSHRTAPVEVRERLACQVTGANPWLGEALGPNRVAEIAVVSTCNRLEVYAVPVDPRDEVGEPIMALLAAKAGLAEDELDQVFYRKRDREAISHLVRVACGLDSQVLGEAQILGQISQSFVAARNEGTVGPLLTFLLSRALHAGKRARTETFIGQGKTSISHAAAALVEADLGGLADKRVIIIGAGDTGRMAVEALRMRGVLQVACVNRSMVGAGTMTGLPDCELLPWSALTEALAGADAVISATSAPHPILYSDDVAAALERRESKPLVLVDIAVPRDIDPLVGELPSVVLYDIDHLEASLDEARACREAAVPRVEQIVVEETEAIVEWLLVREVAPLIHRFRQRARLTADEEARRVIRKLDGLDLRQQELILQMARQVANKILHQPIVRLKAQASQSEREKSLEAFVEMFGLDAEGDDAFAAYDEPESGEGASW